MGLGEACTPVMWRSRLVGVDLEALCRLRRALKDEARGAAMFSSYTEKYRRFGKSVNSVNDGVVNVVLRRAHRMEGSRET